jgi:hypothetical protein
VREASPRASSIALIEAERFAVGSPAAPLGVKMACQIAHRLDCWALLWAMPSYSTEKSAPVLVLSKAKVGSKAKSVRNAAIKISGTPHGVNVN